MPAAPLDVSSPLAPHPGSHRDAQKPEAERTLHVFQLKGTQAQMGHQHGAMLRQMGHWESALEYYPNMPAYMIGSAVPAHLMSTVGKVVIERALSRMEGYRLEAFDARTRAFMRGLGHPERAAKYFFVMDVLQNLVGSTSRLGLKGFAYRMGTSIPPACTSMVTWGEGTEDGRLLHARNFDFPGMGVWDARPMVAFCTPDEGLRYGFVSTRGGDAVGVSAFNEAGLSITSHTRFHQDVVFKGVGVLDLIHEMICEATTIEEAIEIARRRPVASSWALMISSGPQGRAVSLEVAGWRSHEVLPEAGEHSVSCTNRYRHPHMTPGEGTISPAFIANANGRESMARQTGRKKGLGVAQMKALLASNQDPAVPGHERAVGSVVAQPMTVQSVVVDPQRQSIHVSIGRAPTGDGPWVEVPWSWDDAPGQRTIDPQPEAQIDTGSRYDKGPEQRAMQAFVEAIRLDQQAGDHHEVVSWIRRATTLDPKEASYHFLSGGYALKAGLVDEAQAHFDLALELEPSEFYRGQALLWAARTAQLKGQQGAARALRASLAETTDPLLHKYREAAHEDAHAKYTPKDFASMHLTPHLVDAGI